MPHDERRGVYNEFYGNPDYDDGEVIVYKNHTDKPPSKEVQEIKALHMEQSLEEKENNFAQVEENLRVSFLSLMAGTVMTMQRRDDLSAQMAGLSSSKRAPKRCLICGNPTKGNKICCSAEHYRQWKAQNPNNGRKK